MNGLVRFLMRAPGSTLVALALFCLVGCNPYDPVIGGRNAVPGAARHLASRTDIAEVDKTAVLELQPCAPDVLDKLAMDPSREVRSLVAANPSVSVATLEKLLDDKEAGVRGFIVTNRHAPHSILVKLQNDPDYHVGWMLPGNPNWSPEELRGMYARMRREEAASPPAFTSPSVFAGNPATPRDILEELSKDDSYFVQSTLVGNPSLPPAAARRLADSRESSIRRMLAANKATPKDILKELAADPDPEVSRAAQAASGN